jgi:hypothetical protein
VPSRVVRCQNRWYWPGAVAQCAHGWPTEATSVVGTMDMLTPRAELATQSPCTSTTSYCSPVSAIIVAACCSWPQLGWSGRPVTVRSRALRKSLSAASWVRFSTASRFSQYAMPDTDTAAASATSANTTMSRIRSEVVCRRRSRPSPGLGRGAFERSVTSPSQGGWSWWRPVPGPGPSPVAAEPTGAGPAGSPRRGRCGSASARRGRPRPWPAAAGRRRPPVASRPGSRAPRPAAAAADGTGPDLGGC